MILILLINSIFARKIVKLFYTTHKQYKIISNDAGFEN